MNAKKINASDRNIAPGGGVLQNTMVKAGDFNPLVDDVAAIEDAITSIEDAMATAETSTTFDSIAETTSGHGVIIEGVTLKDSQVTSPYGFLTAAGLYAGIIPIAAQQAITASGTNTAVDLTTYYTAITSTGTDDKISLAANGASTGQIKKIKYVEGAGGDTVVLTPSVTTGFATCTFNAVGDYAVFMFNGTYWMCIENFGCTLA